MRIHCKHGVRFGYLQGCGVCLEEELACSDLVDDRTITECSDAMENLNAAKVARFPGVLHSHADPHEWAIRVFQDHAARMRDDPWCGDLGGES